MGREHSPSAPVKAPWIAGAASSPDAPGYGVRSVPCLHRCRFKETSTRGDRFSGSGACVQAQVSSRSWSVRNQGDTEGSSERRWTNGLGRGVCRRVTTEECWLSLEILGQLGTGLQGTFPTRGAPCSSPLWPLAQLSAAPPALLTLGRLPDELVSHTCLQWWPPSGCPRFLCLVLLSSGLYRTGAPGK